jgi:DNA-binding HxlR family transcriptional regulator
MCIGGLEVGPKRGREIGRHSRVPFSNVGHGQDVRYAARMTRTDKKVRYSPTGKLEDVTPDMAAVGVETALRTLEGRWKMIIIFHLFDKKVLRFSELERAIPAVSQKMLIQQLRELERDEIVERKIYPQVPPKVEYRLTLWGQALCPALDSLLEWAALRMGPIGSKQEGASDHAPTRAELRDR